MSSIESIIHKSKVDGWELILPMYVGAKICCVAYYQQGHPIGKVIVLKNQDKYTTPSVVEFCDNGDIIVGEKAKFNQRYKQRSIIDSFHSLIGRKYTDNWGDLSWDKNQLPFNVVDMGKDILGIEIEFNGESECYYIEDIFSHVVKMLKDIAEKHIGFRVKNCVLTVPTHFDFNQREATKDAGILAGLKVLDVIDENIAVAHAYQLYRFTDLNFKTILIYNLSDTTFNVTILKLDRGEVQVLATGDDIQFGKFHIDDKIIAYLLMRAGIYADEGGQAILLLRHKLETLKWLLGTKGSAEITVDNILPCQHLHVEMTWENLNEITKDFFAAIINYVNQTLTKMGTALSDIDDVLLECGYTLIERLICENLGIKRKSDNPGHSVVEGAAIQSLELNGPF
ncbi:unnamed protein product [Oppiella nova]|uniref:Uncharacterized protein n=1 Tax=Oppiella nova TaxID=334625 RepID=A0A7R9Q998_9ACAR|nr:unnamed protein product [Oppiella nova]CAG2159427.1 unnamed protein product [Oppiella nova]